MKKTRIGIFLILLSCNLNFLYAQSAKSDWLFQPEDKRIAEEKLNLYSSKLNVPISELITEIGLSFVDTPYAAATLENGADEKLVINLRELDCTTFVENCLALALTVKMGKTDFESFAAQLEQIRYRDGLRNQYPSRLHYFSDWVNNNQKKGFIDQTPNLDGELFVNPINFMSTHSSSYLVLKEHPELIQVIAEQEKVLTQTGFLYFPKNDLPNLYKNLEHGDIIGLTSSVDGLDVNHVAIVILKNKEFYLLNASQKAGKVLVSAEPLSDYLKPQSKNNGVIIARPIF